MARDTCAIPITAPTTRHAYEDTPTYQILDEMVTLPQIGRRVCVEILDDRLSAETVTALYDAASRLREACWKTGRVVRE